MTQKDHCDAFEIAKRVGGFFSQEVYSNMGEGISQKRPLMRFVLLVVSLMRATILSNFMLIVAIILLYKDLRLPQQKSDIFAYGLSKNNLLAFENLNALLDGEGLIVDVNGRPFTFVDRLRACIQVSKIWRYSKVLNNQTDYMPFVHLQVALGLVALAIFGRHLHDKNLNIVAISNDHSPICIALNYVSKGLELKTIYIQHAPVTEFFPPLRADLNLLHDEASISAYRASHERHGIYFDEKSVAILSPFDTPIHPMRQLTHPLTIGICLSLLPNIQEINKLTTALSTSESVERILLRPHPRYANSLSSLTTHPKVSLSSNNQAIEAFCHDISMALVPNSGIAIEALHYGTPTCYSSHWDTLDIKDYYRYLDRGILIEFDLPIIDNLEYINQFYSEEWRGRFAFFDSTIMKSPKTLRKDAVQNLLRLVGRNKG